MKNADYTMMNELDSSFSIHHSAFFKWALLFLFVAGVAVCSKNPSPNLFQENGGGGYFIGLASYYLRTPEHVQTASGLPYDDNELTAAHRTLPFGTRVLVTNLENSRSVIVTITDRGPNRKDRLIDVSYAAATKLEMLNQGVVKVRVEVLNE